jgi:hypothetical protein
MSDEKKTFNFAALALLTSNRQGLADAGRAMALACVAPLHMAEAYRAAWESAVALARQSASVGESLRAVFASEVAELETCGVGGVMREWRERTAETRHPRRA